MNVRIETKPAFRVAGIAVHDGEASDFSGAWEELFKKYTMEQLDALGSGEPYGSCYDFKGPGEFSYLAGYDVKDTAKAAELGLEVLEVPEARYAVVEIHGSIPDSIRAGWDHLMSDWLPEHGYSHAGTPDFEYYLEGDPSDPDYAMELWVPLATG